jgi:hypothetical protein
MVHFGAMGEELEMSIIELANLMGVTRAYLYRILKNGKHFAWEKEKLIHALNSSIKEASTNHFEDPDMSIALNKAAEQADKSKRQRVAQLSFEKIRMERLLREKEEEYLRITSAINKLGYILRPNAPLHDAEDNLLHVKRLQLLHRLAMLNPSVLDNMRLKQNLIERELELLEGL